MSYYYGNNGGGGRRFLGNVPRVTRSLMIINIILFFGVFIATKKMPPAERGYIPDVITQYFGLFSFASGNFHIWQPFTYMFLHDGTSIWHILFNMYTLYIFGSVIERIIGERKFLIFYLVCGLGASAIQMLTEIIFGPSYMCTVGASGAIYGLLVAYAMLFPTSKLTLIFPPVTLSAKTMVLVFVGIEVFFELIGSLSSFADSVAHLAHLGGMLVGWLLIKYWRSKGTLFNRENL